MASARLLDKDKVLTLLKGFSRLGKRPTILWVSDKDGKVVARHPDNAPLPQACLPSFGQGDPSKAQTPGGERLELPIYVDDELLGWVGSIGEDFRPCLETLRDALSQLACKEMEKKAVLQETLEKYRELNLLYKTSELLGSHLNLDDVLQLLLGQALKATRASSGSIMLVNEHGEVVARADGGGDLPDLPSGKVPLEEVIKSGKPEIVNDGEGGYAGVKSILSVPINVREKTLGVITLYNKGTGAFDSRDERLVSSLAAQTAMMVENAEITEDKRRLRETFQRYVSEEVLNLILTCSGTTPLKGTRAVISVLFADIQNFTSLVEGMDPREVVTLLNHFLSPMVEIVLRHRGTLDKYTGDGIMALYGTPVQVEDHAERALSSALEMVSTLKGLQAHSQLPEGLKVGIGIHTGEAVVGNIGSMRRMEFTAIGDAINTAARLEKMTRELRADVLTTHETYLRTKDRFLFESLGELDIRGKTKRLKLYKVLGMASKA
jgi:adenylate cyclase